MADPKKDMAVRSQLNEEMSNRLGIAVGTVRRLTDYFESKANTLKGTPGMGCNNTNGGPEAHPLVNFNGCSADDTMNVTPSSAAAQENFNNSHKSPQNQPNNELVLAKQQQHELAMKAGAPAA